MVREASAIDPLFAATFGEGHQLTMQVLLTRAPSESSLEQWDAAVQDDLKAHAIAVERLGPQSAVAIVSLSDAAESQCRAGRFGEGAKGARSALDAARQAFGGHGGLPDATAFAPATCLIGSTQFDQASHLLAGLDPNALAHLAGDPGWPANIALAGARIAYRRGDFAAARQCLKTAAPVLEGPDAEPFEKRAVENLLASLAAH